MKVTFVLPHAGMAGGIKVCAIYAQALRTHGHEVSIVSTPRPQPTSLKNRVKTLLKGSGWSNRQKDDPGHFDSLDFPHKVIDRYRPVVDSDCPDADVIIATWWETAEWVAKLSPQKGAKVYFIQHDERFTNTPHHRVEKTWKLPMHRITIAQWLVDLGKHHYHVDQIDLVPNGVSLEQFNAPARGKQKTPTVGMMYSYQPFKGCDISLQAFEIAARNVAGLSMVVFGVYQPTEQLPLPKDSRFTFSPPQDKIKDFYASCDAWLFGSRSEGFGLPILESMACRTPVIGTPTGAAPELIKPGGGVIVKPQDAIDMAKAIERVARMTSPEWKQMSELAYATARANTWDRNADLFEASLLRAIERKTMGAEVHV